MRMNIKSKIKKLVPNYLLIQRLKKNNSGEVLLTFDDGPDPEVTGNVLEMLEGYGIRAIFFIVGKRAILNPDILIKIKEKGHIIGNHSYGHSGKNQTFWAYYKDLRQCRRLIEQYTGEKPRFYRPPAGVISLQSLLIPRILNMRPMTWSLSIGDWKFRSQEEAFKGADTILKTLHPGDIILLHDDNKFVLDILEKILPAVAKGLEINKSLEFARKYSA